VVNSALSHDCTQLREPTVRSESERVQCQRVLDFLVWQLRLISRWCFFSVSPLCVLRSRLITKSLVRPHAAMDHSKRRSSSLDMVSLHANCPGYHCTAQTGPSRRRCLERPHGSCLRRQHAAETHSKRRSTPQDVAAPMQIVPAATTQPRPVLAGGAAWAALTEAAYLPQWLRLTARGSAAPTTW
jgi:hypothetical protein